MEGLSAAGHASAAAIVAVLGSLWLDGKAEVAAGAYRLRAALGASAGAAARIAMAARALTSAAARHAACGPTALSDGGIGPGRLPQGRLTPPPLEQGLAPTESAGGESPYSLEIWHLAE
eukprot:1995768-Pleurochrysis_carterae.AAC.1